MKDSGRCFKRKNNDCAKDNSKKLYLKATNSISTKYSDSIY